MILLYNAIIKCLRLLGSWLYAAISPLVLIYLLLKGLFLRNVKETLLSPLGLRMVFNFLRVFLPTIGIKKSFIHSYENTGTVIVTRHLDVKEIFDRDDVFEAVYQPRMREITEGNDFMLGMENTPTYTKDLSLMQLAVRRDDISNIILPMANRDTEEIFQTHATNHSMDIVKNLTTVIPAKMVKNYFGISTTSEQNLITWSTLLFWYLFLDLNGDEKLKPKAMSAAQELRNAINEAIAELKSSPLATESVLSRYLKMHKANLSDVDDTLIRSHFIGMIIGAIPTISMASVHALDQLLRRKPSILKKACDAASSDNDALFASYVFEALRFSPPLLGVYRRAKCDAVISKNTFRKYKIKKGSMVIASTFSAMFDNNVLSFPHSFRTDRPHHHYLFWGHGLHKCFGQYINDALIPVILKPIFKCKNLHRAEGSQGQIERSNTPFPTSMTIKFD